MRYHLTGKLFDEEGRPYVGVSGTARDGSKRCYYKCLETSVVWRKEDVEEAMRDSVAEMLLASRETCEEIAAMVAEESERRDDEERMLLEADRRRLDAIGRKLASLVELATTGVPVEPIARKMNDLEDERAALEEEVAELERKGIGNMYEVTLFFLEEMRDGKMSAAVAPPLVSRMEVDRDGNTHVEFRIKDRTPVDQETGVLIARKWLGH